MNTPPIPISNPHARSPYQRRAKHPHRYSAALESLGAARRRGDHDEADKLGRAHSAAYGLKATRCETGEVDW